jgi:hypothetical protein
MQISVMEPDHRLTISFRATTTVSQQSKLLITECRITISLSRTVRLQNCGTHFAKTAMKIIKRVNRIVTGYGLTGPGSIPGSARFFSSPSGLLPKGYQEIFPRDKASGA